MVWFNVGEIIDLLLGNVTLKIPGNGEIIVTHAQHCDVDTVLRVFVFNYACRLIVHQWQMNVHIWHESSDSHSLTFPAV